jgi:hypothetical protein
MKVEVLAASDNLIEVADAKYLDLNEMWQPDPNVTYQDSQVI